MQYMKRWRGVCVRVRGIEEKLGRRSGTEERKGRETGEREGREEGERGREERVREQEREGEDYTLAVPVLCCTTGSIQYHRYSWRHQERSTADQPMQPAGHPGTAHNMEVMHIIRTGLLNI